jgi:two-component system cell cycle sensor histidine kinase/response regulator CckA
VTQLAGALRDASQAPVALRFRSADRGWRLLEGRAYGAADEATNTVVLFQDVTEETEAASEQQAHEERLQRTEKLDSLGVLAGGIAHDFNNLLTPIVGHASLLLADLPDGSPARRGAQAIRTAADRATALTSQMLTYAGRSGRQVSMLDVSTVIEDISLLLSTTASSASHIEYHLERDLPFVHGDSAQITQMMVNLVANASEGLGADGGRIAVRTDHLHADRELLNGCHVGQDRPTGEYVSIEVSDDGDGIDAATRERILDPFFSTRPGSRGLGLAVVAGAVRAHGGALRFDPSTEGGTRFRILLPTLSGAIAHPRPAAARETHVEARPSEPRTILIVDDDDGARELTGTVLARAGFHVCEASDGPRAIELYARNGADIAAVLVDATMPGMSGAHVFDALRELDPRARVILVSGHSREQAADSLWPRGLAGFLHKPYESDVLLAAVGRVLDDSFRSS